MKDSIEYVCEYKTIPWLSGMYSGFSEMANDFSCSQCRFYYHDDVSYIDRVSVEKEFCIDAWADEKADIDTFSEACKLCNKYAPFSEMGGLRRIYARNNK